MGAMKGIEQFEKRLAAMEKKVANRVIKSALRDGAKVMAGAVKAGARVASGKLRRSVKVRAGRRRKDTQSVAVVVTGGHESPMVAAEEYGTSGQAAHPFIRPGFEATKDPVLALMIDRVREGIESAGR